MASATLSNPHKRIAFGLAMTLPLALTVVNLSSASAAPKAPRAVVSHRKAKLCPAGDTVMSFVNKAGLKTYGAVTLTGAASITPKKLVNVSNLIADYPVDPNDPSGQTHYFCNSHWKGSGAGNFWVSIGHPIVGLPAIQPTVTSPYRWAEVEFGAPGVGGTTDLTNVNAFSFPLDMQAYSSPGGSKPEESSLFRGNTCQIVKAMHTAIERAGAGAGWKSIEQTNGGLFTRIIGPITYNGTKQQADWPSMNPYINGFKKTLPIVTSGKYSGDRGPFMVEGYYSKNKPAPGWFYYQGYIAPDNSLTIAGRISQKTPAPSGGVVGGSITISNLAAAIYSEAQGPHATGGYNVSPTPPWWPDYNDVYAVVVNDTLSAFNYGYWGSNYGTGKDNKFFWKDWSPPISPTIGRPAYPSKPSAYGRVPYNIYAKVLNGFSRNYAFSYNEQYGGGGNGNPLLTLPTNGEFRVTLPSDGFARGSKTQCVTGGGGQGGGGVGVGLGASSGYWEVAADGGLFAFGDAKFYGSMGSLPLNQAVVGLAATPDGGGYWEVAADGGLFAFGDAKFYGSMGGQHLNAAIVGMAATPDGGGYWEVAADGGLFAFGDAKFYGSMGSLPLNQPVVGLAATPDGGGYWEVAADGGLFAFGDAKFYGSMGGQHLNAAIVGLAATPDGGGYWEVAADGGLFAFGDAKFYGSMGSLPLNQPVVGLAATPDGGGYWEVAADGGLFAFGDAKFYGSMGSQHLNAAIVGMDSNAG